MRRFDGTFRTFVPDGCRPGVVRSIGRICERVSSGDCRTTTIVLAPRYGKSNVIRQTAVELIETGIVYCCVAISPWKILRDQLNNEKKIEQMQRFHRTDLAIKRVRIVPGTLYGGQFGPHFYEDKPRRHWWGLTNGAACQEATLNILTGAARIFAEQYEKPMLAFIDESHCIKSGSPEGWTKFATALELAGAHVVLLTGTPDRTDNTTAYGFATEEVNATDIKFSKREKTENGPERVFFQAERVTHKLKPDVEVSTRQAWEEKAIVKVEVRKFRFKADEVWTTEIDNKGIARKALSAGMRDNGVIHEAADILLDELSLRQKVRPETAAIVYVGNDRVDDEGHDYHAREVRRIIQALANKRGMSPSVIIATLGNDEGDAAAKKISKFVGDDETPGFGDILIVKQMGGVGLDVPRLKICLDLSTVRTKPNTAQRWLRVTTLWNGTTHGTLILPDDACTSELHEAIITSQGGECHSIRNTVEIDRKPDTDGLDLPPKLVTISDAERNGAADHDLTTIEQEDDRIVDALLSIEPQLSTHTRVTIWSMYNRGLLRFPDGFSLDSPTATQPGVFNTTQKIKDHRAQIVNLARDIAGTRYNYVPGSSGDGQNELWVSEMKGLQSRAKFAAGIECELGRCLDVEKLAAAEKFLEQIQQEQIREIRLHKHAAI